jgi:hypothetical protein
MQFSPAPYYFIPLGPKYIRANWVPRHHSMARPQVAVGDDLRIWTVAANTPKNQPTKDGPPA